jgi:tetratricopeptide (TPR) repeat protein
VPHLTEPQLLGEAKRLHGKAVAEGRYGHAAQAIRTLRRAVAVLDRCTARGAEHDALMVEVLLSLAVNEAEVHGVDRGLTTLADAQRWAQRVEDRRLRVRLHSNHGFIATRAGNLAEADEQLTIALSMIDFATPHDRIYILLNSGNICLYRGQLNEARRLLAAAAETAEAEDIADGRFRALHNLGYVEFLAGDIPSALRSMDAAAALDVDVSLGIWALDRARILFEAGLISEADDTLAQAWRIFRGDRLAQDLGEVEVARAECALVSGDIPAARRFAARARDRFRRRGNLRWMRTAELTLLQADLAAGRPGARLAPVAMRLETELLEDGQGVRARTAALVGVEALLSARRLPNASAVMARLSRGGRSEPITARIHRRFVTARVDLAAGDRTAARRQIRRGLDELAAYQAGFGSIDLRTAAAVHGRHLAELDVRLAIEGGHAAAVFSAAERARAVSSRLPTIRPPDDPAAAELLAELRQVVESLQGAGRDPASAAALVERRAELERRIVARSWTISGSGPAVRPAPVEAIRAQLAGRDATMVTFVQAQDSMAAVVVADRMRMVELGASRAIIEQVRRVRADLDVLAHPRLSGGIRAAVLASLQRSLHELDTALLAPLGVDGPLVLVSTGVLGQLPWASLPSLRGRPLVVAPSATKWLRSTTVHPSPSITVAALAGPALDRAPEEAAGVGNVWPGTQVVHDATTGSLIDAMASATVLHVAAHGVHQPENPLFSSLRMVDGPVFAHELDQKAHAPEHVVLSACEVGLATIRPGDEALGLASVLLQLGTRSVIAGVARVGDEVAEQTMAAYHARLASGLDSAAALADALTTVDAGVAPPFVNFGAAWAAGPERGVSTAS